MGSVVKLQDDHSGTSFVDLLEFQLIKFVGAVAKSINCEACTIIETGKIYLVTSSSYMQQ